MNHDRAPLALVAIIAFAAGALLMTVVIVGPPREDSLAQRTASPSPAEPSFAGEGAVQPVRPCRGAQRMPNSGQPAIPLSAASGVARLGSGAGGGLIYHPGLQTLLVPQREREDAFQAITVFGDRAGSVHLRTDGASHLGVAAETDGASTVIAYVPDTPYLALLPDPVMGTVQAGDPLYVDMRAVRLHDVTAMAVARDGKTIFLLDDGSRIVRVQLGADPTTAAGRMPEVCRIPAQPGVRFTGVAVRHEDGHIFVQTAGAGSEILELAPDGREVGRYALDPGLTVQPGAMVFAPSSSPADRPGSEQLYVLAENDEHQSRLMALAFDPPVPAGAQAVGATVVRTQRTGAWSPPSADPTGIGYDAAKRSLVVADSEADELPSYAHVNLWHTDTSGSVTKTALARTGEPTGVAATPDGAAYFISDDGDDAVLVVQLGADGELRTRDDIQTQLSTAEFGSEDPEGLAFGQRSLFIADGSGRRVFRLAAGPNGVFDGIPPDGDDQVFSFDVASLGMTDPEGIAYDPDRGTLYIVDRERDAPILETTTGGELLRRISTKGTGLRSPSGIEIAPSSDDPNRRSLYVTDRGVDNAVNPSENDGRLLEIRPAAR